MLGDVLYFVENGVSFFLGKGRLFSYHLHRMLIICLLKFAGTSACRMGYLKTGIGHPMSEHKEVATLGASCDFSDDSR